MSPEELRAREEQREACALNLERTIFYDAIDVRSERPKQEWCAQAIRATPLEATPRADEIRLLKSEVERLRDEWKLAEEMRAGSGLCSAPACGGHCGYGHALGCDAIREYLAEHGGSPFKASRLEWYSRKSELDSAHARVKELEAAVEAANFRALMAQADDSVRDALAAALLRVKELERESANLRAAFPEFCANRGELQEANRLLQSANARVKELEAALEGHTSVVAEAREDLQEMRRDRDSMKAWAAGLFVHVCRLTGTDPRSAPQQIKAITKSVTQVRDRAVAERVRDACAELFRHSWRTSSVTRHEAYERVRGLDLDELLKGET